GHRDGRGDRAHREGAACAARLRGAGRWQAGARRGGGGYRAGTAPSAADLTFLPVLSRVRRRNVKSKKPHYYRIIELLNRIPVDLTQISPTHSRHPRA